MRRAFVRSGFSLLLVATAGAYTQAALAAPAAEVRARDRPEVEGDDGPPWDRPRLVAEGAVGAARHTGNFGEEQGLGPAWHARIGAQLGPVVGLDLHYAGAHHPAGRRVSLSTTALSFDARLSLPLGRVRPYLTSGLGWYQLEVEDAGGRPLIDAPWATQVPLGAGVEVTVDERLGVAAGVNSHLFFAQQVSRALLADTHMIGAALSARAYF